MPPRRLLLVILLALAFVAGGVVVERLPLFDAARTALRGHTGPAGLPDGGNPGRIVAVATSRAGAGGAFAVRPEDMPSSAVLDAADREDPLPVLSIVADEDHLWDPEIGILANPRQSGRPWERLAWTSLFEGGELVLATRAGLRVHGDSSRRLGRPSLRLHLREMYGASPADGGRLLGPGAEPAAAVVVLRVWPEGQFTSLFAFEIGRRVGSIVPDFRPARLFLNGENQGVFVLTERVRQDGWGRSQLGNDDFLMFVWKAEIEPRGLEAFQQFEGWVKAQTRLTMADAARRVDVDNLTRHLFTDMFCFTTDWAQGAAVLNRSDREPRWFFVHWDMDQSFATRGTVDLAPWEQPVMELVTLDLPRERLEELSIITDDIHFKWHDGDVRRHLFLRLLEDPAYREYFLRFVTEALNHRLTPEFFADLLDRYALLAGEDGSYGGVRLDLFFEHRPDVVRRRIAEHFGMAPPVEVTLEAPADAGWGIDGYAASGPYRGSYFVGQRLRVVPDAATAARLSYWQIDGRRVDDPVIDMPVVRPTRIEAVLASR